MKLQLGRRRRPRKADSAKLAAQLAPLEELEKNNGARPEGISSSLSVAQTDIHDGSIVIDNQGLQVPAEIMEGGDEKTYLGMEPVVIVILGVMLLFIAFIAWQISLLPSD